MARIYNSFEFIGNISFNKDENKVLETIQYDSGWQTKRLNVGIKPTATNGIFLKADALYNPTETNTIFTMGKDGSKLEIPFKDRNKQSSIDMVADFKKFTVDLETNCEVKTKRYKLKYQIINIENREEKTAEDLEKLANYKKEYIENSTNLHEFISDYDFILFLKESAVILKQHKIRVKGSLDMSMWNEKYYVGYVPNHVEFIQDEVENKLEATIDVYFDKNAIDDTLLKTDGKLLVNGYLISYDKNAKGDRFFPKTMVLKGVNFEDEAQVSQYEMLKSFIETDKNTIYHMLWNANIYKGAEIKEFTYNDLTDAQKKMVDVGLSTVEQYRPKNGYVGGNIDEFRLFNPVLEGDFKDGIVDSLMTEEEFIKLLAVQIDKPKKQEVKKQVSEEVKEIPTTAEPTPEVKAQLNKLFG